ncbi:hypothetical protein HELRODRAFT_79486 [Helobdella robusta]|uniref:alpha-L-fucosidase n=1 Tax=Helobdella robusta TaxID=6412 RepID=T1G3P4_HELRO|nr:hypothetical protein HELRODRAFT_79486 [Helobdella robusta]ESO03950.1 hypothetical protein HELRODRAFT_79486 [Helobdella robusta]
MTGLCIFIAALVLPTLSESGKTYLPTWESLDSRPLPAWFDEAKIGIFLHWGVFSVPSFQSEWFWNSWNNGNPAAVEFMKKNYPPNFTYADFGSQFKAEFYDTDLLADIFKDAGAKYVVLTSKHHEGYTNWPSNYSWNWNSMDVGPKKDLVGELATSIRKRTDLRFGLYHSMFEWYHPLYLNDKSNNFKTNLFTMSKTLPELYEIVNLYKPDVVWSDGEWEASYKYWNSTEFLAWLYNDSPVKNTVVVNDRWGGETLCKHGGFYTCTDRFNPGVLQKHKWENCMTMDLSSWGYRRVAQLKDIITINKLIYELASTISCGGNILINAGIRSDGRIDPIFEERLRQLGTWLKVNEEAVYSSVPWKFQNDTITENIWYTSKQLATSKAVYVFVLDWPSKNILTLGAPQPSSSTKVTMIGHNATFQWSKLSSSGGMNITFPYISPNQLPSMWAWVLKLQNLNN